MAARPTLRKCPVRAGVFRCRFRLRTKRQFKTHGTLMTQDGPGGGLALAVGQTVLPVPALLVQYRGSRLPEGGAWFQIQTRELSAPQALGGGSLGC